MTPQQAQQILADMNSGKIIWDDNLRAQANNAGGSSGGGGGFSFDFSSEAEKAYGELGAYYDRILKESQGDMNKALARMTEDYDTGKRIRQEDYQAQVDSAQREQEMGIKSAQNNALARGIYQKSLSDPTGGFGIYDENAKLINEGAQRTQDALAKNLSRQNEVADTTSKRFTEDTKTQQERQAFDLEQQRRKESASLANSRASTAFQNWQMKNAV